MDWSASHTLGGGVLATEVLVLVTTDEALGLDLGGGATGKLLVEVDDALHADGIGGGADGLWFPSRSVNCPKIQCPGPA